MLKLKVVFDFAAYKNGRMRLVLIEVDAEKPEVESAVVDQEIIRRHPALLRVRMLLALGRMKRRQRKIKKFMSKGHNLVG